MLKDNGSAKLLDAAAALIESAKNEKLSPAAADGWLGGYEASVSAAKSAALVEELRARLYRLMDAIRDQAIAGTNFDGEVEEAYDAAVGIFGLPTLKAIDDAETAANPQEALAKLAMQETSPDAQAAQIAPAAPTLAATPTTAAGFPLAPLA